MCLHWTTYSDDCGPPTCTCRYTDSEPPALIVGLVEASLISAGPKWLLGDVVKVLGPLDSLMLLTH